MKVTPELEAAAKAVYYATRLSPDTAPKWDDANATARAVCFSAARAALTANREPTDGMVDAILEAAKESQTTEANFARDTHRAVIDYILGGER